MPIPANFTLLALLPLIAWRMVSRIRRMVGRQRLSRIRPWVTLVVFPLVLGLIGIFAYPHWERLWWLAGGFGAGVVVAFWGLKLTRFEPTREGLFYTPNAYLGVTLSVLLVARIGWRLFETFTRGLPATSAADADFVRSPLTLAVFGLLAGYYIAYAIGLLRWRFGVMRTKREREAAASSE